MKKKMHPFAGLPTRIEITYANGDVDVFGEGEIVDFGAQEISHSRKEFTIDVRLKIGTHKKPSGLMNWLLGVMTSIVKAWE